MRPILPGARGPAVEDVQRRLLKMGFDLGPTGVDGVFLGMTREAVTAFQRRLGLDEDGVVGQETWSALVDSTFTLGDRALYLRLPHFHGHDVAVLQDALSALGFSCGSNDAIFGPSTEHAVRLFQRNSGQPADGIAGPGTIAALMNLRHVWEGKSGTPAGTVFAGSVRSSEALRSSDVIVLPHGDIAQEIARRFVNLALAFAHDARVRIVASYLPEDAAPGKLRLVVTDFPVRESAQTPLVVLDRDSEMDFTARLATALAVMTESGAEVTIDVSGMGCEDETLQRGAVNLLDAVCAALA